MSSFSVVVLMKLVFSVQYLGVIGEVFSKQQLQIQSTFTVVIDQLQLRTQHGNALKKLLKSCFEVNK